MYRLLTTKGRAFYVLTIRRRFGCYGFVLGLVCGVEGFTLTERWDHG